MGKTPKQKYAWPVTLGARQDLFLTWLSAVLFVVLMACCLGSPCHAADTTPAGTTQWSSLTPTQQQALGPLAGSWNTFGPERQQKWLAFAGKFQKMSPADQQRSLQKMDAWVKLTPEQRLAARENYIRSNKLQPDQRAQKWQEYQQLPAEQKAQLASHAKKPLITNLPTPAESKQKKLQPLKKPAIRPNPAPVAPATAQPLPATTLMPSSAAPGTNSPVSR